MMDTFLTSYDPSDLPGSSVDPLGFDRAYMMLADKILPGLTNVARYPRYFGLLCAGVELAKGADELPERRAREKRRDAILMLERFWAVANELAFPGSAGGVRGVSYVRRHLGDLERTRKTSTTGSYKLLSRQEQYGCLGVYGSVADGMRFLNRDDLILTPDLGQVMGEAFLKETGCPPAVRRAVQGGDSSEVSLNILKAWGNKAYVGGKVGPQEADCIKKALYEQNDTRARMAGELSETPFNGENDNEMARLLRIEQNLKRTAKHADLLEAIRCIRALESCYRHAMLAFERLLWLCRNHSSSHVTLDELSGDPVIGLVRRKIPGEYTRLESIISEATTPEFAVNQNRLDDVLNFLKSAALNAEDTGNFVEVVVKRHSDIQRGKFDQGRPKMPWLEQKDSTVLLTMAKSGGFDREVTDSDQIGSHPYRLASADSMIAAAQGVGHT